MSAASLISWWVPIGMLVLAVILVSVGKIIEFHRRKGRFKELPEEV